jgi:hypothetical protein
LQLEQLTLCFCGAGIRRSTDLIAIAACSMGNSF